MEGAQTRLMLALAVALVVVTGVLFAQGDPAPPVDPDATVPVWLLSADSVERIELSAGEAAPKVLQRFGEDWKVLGVGPANPDRVSALLAALELVERGVPVEDPGDPAEYGLGEPPDHRVVLTLRSGLDQELRVGGKVPTGYRTYVQAPSGPILAVHGDLPRVLDPGPTGWRDDRVFRFDPAAVRRVEVRSPGGVLALAGQGTTWAMEGFGRADPDKVDDVVMGILDLRFDAYLDTDQVIRGGRYGVRVELADGQVHSVELGDSTPMGVVASTGDGRFGTIYEEFLRQLGRGPSDVGDPRAFPIDHERIEGLAVELDGQTFVAERNGPTWTSTLGEADTWEVVQRLAEVGVSHRPTPPEGAGEGRGRVVIHQGGSSHVVHLGDRVGDFWLARDQLDAGTFRIVAADLDPVLERLFP